MKEIVILSGKGGTGKTTLTASLSVLVKDKIIADCDVDAPDLHLLLSPEIKERKDFKGGTEVKINNEECIECGLCRELCKFEAISEDFIIDDFLCEGCGLCFHACPQKAIKMEIQTSGYIYLSQTRYGEFVHAQLFPGEENSGRLSAEVKNMAREIGIRKNKKYIIIDGPPGIGCPVISSLSGADLAIIITEPTQSGISDLERIIQLSQFFKIESKIIINKYDINPRISEEIEKFGYRTGIEILSKIPFSEEVVEALKNKIPVAEYSKGIVYREILKIKEKIFGND